ncbi:class II fructose-bisphosphate aldolase [Boudabousia marimammalium]|uniref:Fructose-bisphosphate aldolase n=1 Tax=Boudabousia marimammalium TaxID=156892 RepID=A0A1Q5PQR8_9ACTO|nr:class II fructose-bisphosphate aldolase [Boudabousia marimammalium]OKL49907.1 fructose-bisphosphate aldolase [Boudabousia marimammalium]
MSLVDLKSVSEQAQKQGVGLGAFNVVLLDHAEQFVRAAERAELPVVLQLSENAVKYHGAFEPIADAILACARGAAVPVVAHLDHAEDVDLCRKAVAAGFTSVMYDGSKLPDQLNRDTTAKVVDFCHAAGLSVEAELGEVGGKNGVHDPSARTDPDDAAKFVADTGVDLLAVAVGSSHAMTTRGAELDNALIAAIASKVSVPLVLHGSSGVPDAGIISAIESGMTKINVSTHLNVLFTKAVREYLTADSEVVDPRKYFQAGNAAVFDEVYRLLKMYSLTNEG